MSENEKKSINKVSLETPLQEKLENASLESSPDFLNEIQQENARSAEDAEERKRHDIPMLNYENFLCQV